MPKIPKPPAGYEYLGRKISKKKKPPLGGRDTRPTEMMPPRKKTMRPRPATPKKPVPMPRGGTRSGYEPVPMPKNRPRKAQPRRGY